MKKYLQARNITFILALSMHVSLWAQDVAPATQPAPEATPVISPETTPVPALTPAAPKDESLLIFGGSVYLALENWSRVGDSGDSKMGFGFGGEFGLGAKIDEMKVLVGPHISFNRWSADYSHKYQSATDSVYVEMMDFGLMLMSDFGDMYLNIGAGKSEISSGMIVSGKDIKYGYSGENYSYTHFSIGTNWDRMLLGVGVVNYSGYAKYADRVEFILGYGF